MSYTPTTWTTGDIITAAKINNLETQYAGVFDSSAKTFAGDVTVSGNYVVGASKFTVAAATGNTVVAGTLGVTGLSTLSSATVTGTLGVGGDFSVNTNKFTVTASNGNTVVAGTLGVTGTITGTLSGNVTGNLTGNVTGNVTGSSGSCTGNAATSSSCSGNAATSSSCSGNAATSSSCTGNAATVTNGVYTNGSYNDPAWITGLSGSKITGTAPLSAVVAPSGDLVIGAPAGQNIRFQINGSDVVVFNGSGVVGGASGSVTSSVDGWTISAGGGFVTHIS